MKPKVETKQLAQRTLEFLTSAEGKKALREAADESKKTTEPFRRARNVASERLHRRFTV